MGIPGAHVLLSGDHLWHTGARGAPEVPQAEEVSC